MRRSLVLRASPLSVAVVKELLREVTLSESPMDVNRRERILKKHGAARASIDLFCEALEGATMDVEGAA